MRPRAKVAQIIDLDDHAGLQALREAWECAHDAKIDPWQFAVEIQTLRSGGLSNNSLRWLIAKKLAEHGAETTGPASTRRRFRRTACLRFSERDCFVLTSSGYKDLERLADVAVEKQGRTTEGLISPEQTLSTTLDAHQRIASELPIWDPRLRELRIGEIVIKRFRHPARAQEAILCAFQEEGWPPAIDDPLPGQLGVDAKRRLHYTVRNLNRGQRPKAIRFFINGNGELVRWDICPSPARNRRASGARPLVDHFRRTSQTRSSQEDTREK